jgi:rare lipoprotein A (peptidoglycan hydrolase)
VESVVQAAVPMAGGPVGQLGVAAFAFALAVPFVGGGRAWELHPISDAEADAVGDAPNERLARGHDPSEPARRAVLLDSTAGAVEQRESTRDEATPVPPVAAPSSGAVVVASWYGPGFYGNRTACGLTYGAEVLGVAHRTLPCGTMMTLTYAGRSVAVPVIDRGPYVAGRTLDLSNATRAALGCPDLCTLSMRLGP